MLAAMTRCGRCERAVDDQFRYCPWCAAPQRLKLVEFFRGRAGETRALRVSRYLGGDRHERQVRVSIWDECGRAEAVVGLDESEAARLGAFLRDAPSAPARPALRDAVTARLRRAPPR
jgi:hypothetical protein